MSLINENNELIAFCNKLRKSKFITVDTEFMRENTFWPELCLIQLANTETSGVIDPLVSNLDLSPIYELMKEKKILKVFHAGRQDLEIFFNKCGFIPEPVFDTQIGAMVCGFGESVSYETLVKEIVGKKTDKLSRFTDWSRRPLTDRQKNYALNDVIYLVTIYKSIKDKIDKMDRNEWIKEEIENLVKINNYKLEPKDAWKRIKSKNHSGKFLSILKEIAAWREQLAQKKNIPRNRILRDESLLEIAAHTPTNKDSIKKTRGISKFLNNDKYISELIEKIKFAKLIPESEFPVIEKKQIRRPNVGPLVDLLKVLLKLRCNENNVAHCMVANAKELNKIAANEKDRISALQGWRYEIFGRDAIDLVNGKISLTNYKGQVIVKKINND